MDIMNCFVCEIFNEIIILKSNLCHLKTIFAEKNIYNRNLCQILSD